MRRLKQSMGLLLAGAIMFIALGAMSATAATQSEEHCLQVVGTATKYTNNQCNVIDEAAGTWRWARVTTPQLITLTLIQPIKISSTNAGVKFTISCSGIEGTGEITPEAESTSGKNVKIAYTGCTVTEPAGKGCVVRGSADAAGSGKISTNTLKSKQTNQTAEPFYAVKYEPATGTTFGTIVVSGCSTAVLNGEKAITGSLRAVMGSGGEVQEFTSTSGSELKFGGQALTLLGGFKFHTATTANAVRVATP